MTGFLGLPRIFHILGDRSGNTGEENNDCTLIFRFTVTIRIFGYTIRRDRDLIVIIGRPDLNLALTKLHLFRLSSLFSTLIYLDADVLPLRPLSHLFTTTSPHIISACPDTGWPDCFNSGVMVVRPRESDWEGLKGLLDQAIEDDSVAELAESGGGGKGNGSFDGADQGLLNEWFSSEGGGGDWNRLSFT